MKLYKGSIPALAGSEYSYIAIVGFLGESLVIGAPPPWGASLERKSFKMLPRSVLGTKFLDSLVALSMF